MGLAEDPLQRPPALGQPRQDVRVVNDFIAYIDRAPKALQRILHNLDGPIHSGAEPARVSKDDFHDIPPKVDLMAECTIMVASAKATLSLPGRY